MFMLKKLHFMSILVTTAAKEKKVKNEANSENGHSTDEKPRRLAVNGERDERNSNSSRDSGRSSRRGSSGSKGATA